MQANKEEQISMKLVKMLLTESDYLLLAQSSQPTVEDLLAEIRGRLRSYRLGFKLVIDQDLLKENLLAQMLPSEKTWRVGHLRDIDQLLNQLDSFEAQFRFCFPDNQI